MNFSKVQFISSFDHNRIRIRLPWQHFMLNDSLSRLEENETDLTWGCQHSFKRESLSWIQPAFVFRSLHHLTPPPPTDTIIQN